MSKINDRRIEKLAALLKQAKDVAGTPEELAFREKFAQLTAKWGIESDRVLKYLAEDDPSMSQPGAITRDVNLSGKYLSMQTVLLGSIAQSLHSWAIQENNYRIRLIGMADHLERIEALFRLISPDMVDSAMREGRYYKGVLTPGRMRVWRKSYMIGYITRTCELLAEAEKRAAREAGALVLFKSDKERADEKMMEIYPNVKHQQVGGGFDEIAYHQGHARADRAGLVG